MEEKITKILVQLHLYYHDQLDFFIEKLQNMDGTDWDLIVTYSQWDEASAEKLMKFKPDTKFIKVENIGYDIWPFIKVIKNVNLGDYDYVIKLHTKRSVEKIKITKATLKGYEWRDSLVNAILNDTEYFHKLINRFETDKSIGMASSVSTLSLNAWDTFKSHVTEEMDRMGVNLHKGPVALGTMFLARAEIFTPLKKDWISADYFNDHKSVSGYNFTKSHIYERILSLLPLHYGLKHIGVSPDLKLKLKANIGHTLKTPMEWVFCLFRKGEEHRKALRILGIEFYIGKPKNIYFSDKNTVDKI